MRPSSGMSCRRVYGGLCPGQHFSSSGIPGGAGSHPAEPLGLGQMAAVKLRLAQSHRPGFGNPAMHGPRRLHAHKHLGEWMVQPCPYLGCGSLNLGFRFLPPAPAPPPPSYLAGAVGHQYRAEEAKRQETRLSPALS